MIAVAVARIAINATIPPAKITAGIATRSRSVRLDITCIYTARIIPWLCVITPRRRTPRPAPISKPRQHLGVAPRPARGMFTRTNAV